MLIWILKLDGINRRGRPLWGALRLEGGGVIFSLLGLSLERPGGERETVFGVGSERLKGKVQARKPVAKGTGRLKVGWAVEELGEVEGNAKEVREVWECAEGAH